MRKYIEAEFRFHLNPALGCNTKPLRCECCVYKLVVNVSDSLFFTRSQYTGVDHVWRPEQHTSRGTVDGKWPCFMIFCTLSWKKICFYLFFFFGFLIALSPTWHIPLPNVFLTILLTHNLQVLFQFKIVRDNNVNTLCCLTPRLWHGTMQFILVSQISIYLLLYLKIHIW